MFNFYWPPVGTPGALTLPQIPPIIDPLDDYILLSASTIAGELNANGKLDPGNYRIDASTAFAFDLEYEADEGWLLVHQGGDQKVDVGTATDVYNNVVGLLELDYSAAGLAEVRVVGLDATRNFLVSSNGGASAPVGNDWTHVDLAGSTESITTAGDHYYRNFSGGAATWNLTNGLDAGEEIVFDNQANGVLTLNYPAANFSDVDQIGPSITLKPFEKVRITRQSGFVYTVTNRYSGSVEDIDWARSTQDKVSDTLNLLAGNSPVRQFNVSFTPDVSGYYVVEHSATEVNGTGILYISELDNDLSTGGARSDHFSTLTDRITNTETTKRYAVELEAGTEYFFYTQSGGGSNQHKPSFCVYPVSHIEKNTNTSDLHKQLSAWELTGSNGSAEATALLIDGADEFGPYVDLFGGATNGWTFLRTTTPIEVGDKIQVVWDLDAAQATIYALRGVIGPGAIRDVILRPTGTNETDTISVANPGAWQLNSNTIHNGMVTTEIEALVAMPDGFQIYPDYGQVGANGASNTVVGSIRLRSVDTKYLATETPDIANNYQGVIPGGNYDFTILPSPVTGNTFIDDAVSNGDAVLGGTRFLAGGDGSLTTFDAGFNSVVTNFTQGDRIEIVDDALFFTRAVLNVNADTGGAGLASVTGYAVDNTDTENPVIVNRITEQMRRWTLNNDAQIPVDATVYGQDAVRLEDAGGASFYRIDTTELFEGNAVDPNRVFRFNFARNLPDVTSTVMFRFSGASGSQNDIVIDPPAGTVTPENNVTVLEQNVTDASIEVAFRHDNGGYTSLQLHPVYGDTGATTANSTLTGVQYPLDIDLDYGVPINDQFASGYFDVGSMRVQTGEFTSNTDGLQTVTLPAAFASANYQIFFQAKSDGGANLKETNIGLGWGLDSQTASQFVMDRDNDISGGAPVVGYFAVGPKP